MSILNKISRLRKNVKNWYLRPLERYGLVGKEIRYKLRNNLIFTFKAMTERSTLSIVEEMLEGNPYNSPKVKLEKGDIVLDIGANIGSFSIMQVKYFPGISVIAYEPDPDNYKYLEKNIQQNNFSKNITPNKLAVVGKKKEDFINLSLSPDQSGSHSVMERGWNNESEVVKVPVIEFGEILESYTSERDIPFVKMDCEGAEHDILMNTKSELLLKIEYLALEYHDVPGYSLEELKKHLVDLGFLVLTTNIPGIWQCFNTTCKKYKK